ncbi:hypothetical protein BCR34DRAFT_388636 [Clohesyomyces aquaticus]|uniref:Uncharacterized protein n=1 Tax=Clohesyomyces aquaticus TaxID=1231657 RepID=A0A1Y1ZFP9_9PLEO|nr:hypothetical protein BCR34DRAFT_388636 [Clohesyomyces aquaticus]
MNSTPNSGEYHQDSSSVLIIMHTMARLFHCQALRGFSPLTSSRTNCRKLPQTFLRRQENRSNCTNAANHGPSATADTRQALVLVVLILGTWRGGGCKRRLSSAKSNGQPKQTKQIFPFLLFCETTSEHRSKNTVLAVGHSARSTHLFTDRRFAETHWWPPAHRRSSPCRDKTHSACAPPLPSLMSLR